jgi:hypothetical protein
VIRIVKNFLSLGECDELNTWTINHYSQPYFTDPNMDSYHKGTRFTTRGKNKVINYPDKAYKIQDRIESLLNIQNPLYPRQFYNGIINGVGLEHGSIFKHKDPVYYPGTITVHCNFLTQKPIGGGVTIIGEIEYDINEGDMLMYAVSEIHHEVTAIIGEKIRIIWCYGFCLSPDKVREIF